MNLAKYFPILVLAMLVSGCAKDHKPASRPPRSLTYPGSPANDPDSGSDMSDMMREVV